MLLVNFEPKLKEKFGTPPPKSKSKYAPDYYIIFLYYFSSLTNFSYQ
jgi:hypothetical protein